MIELAPGWVLAEEDSTPHHWIAACGDLAILMVYDGSQSDLRHVAVTEAMLDRMIKRRRGRKRFLFVIADDNRTPPETAIRSAIGKSIPKFAGHLERVAIVIPGNGFSAAIQRGVVIGFSMIARHQVALKVENELRTAIEHVAFGVPGLSESLLRVCAARMKV